MNIELEENERIDDLEYNGLKIIQNKNGFCFGIDSVLLTDFSKEIKPNSKIMDSVTNLSATTEEVAASTNNLTNMSNENVGRMNEMTNRLDTINEAATKMKECL